MWHSQQGIASPRSDTENLWHVQVLRRGALGQAPIESVQQAGEHGRHRQVGQGHARASSATTSERDESAIQASLLHAAAALQEAATPLQ